MALLFSLGLSSCDNNPIALKAQIDEMHQKIGEYQQAQAAISAESAKLGHLGSYENAGVKEHTAMRVQIESLKKDLEVQKSVVQKLQGHIETLQRELDDYRANS